MRKGIFLTLAASLAFAALPSFASAATGSAAVVATVSFRTAPSTSSTVLKYFKPGDKLSVLDDSNSYWLKVRDANGTIGYVSSNDKFVDYDDTPSSNPILTGANAIAASAASFRQSPSTDGTRIRYLKQGEQLVITSVVNSYWYAVKDASGESGYVSSKPQYVTVTGALPQTPAPTPVPAPSTPSANQQVEKVIAAGLKYLGTPYEYGSDRNTTATFDCSDFVRQAFKDALNMTLPASSSQIGAYVRGKNAVTTDWHALKRGDLMFFMDYKGTKASLYSGKSSFSEKISHVGIYLGDGQILHTYSKESGGVRIDKIEGKHWEYRFLFGGSAL